MNLYDPVPEIVRLGYTERESEFLGLVARLSGFFLARQYARFLDRKPGALIQQLLTKGPARGDIGVLDYGQRRYVYHLRSRRLYRLVQDEDSPSRHIKGHDLIRAKLMMLDYALEHSGDAFLVSPQEKSRHFQQVCRISLSLLSSASGLNLGVMPDTYARCIADRLPFYLFDRGPLESPGLRFAYFDSGHMAIQSFIRYLESYRALLEELGEFQMVYVGLSDRHFEEAAHNFNRLILKTQTSSPLLPRGADHFIQYLEVRQLWNRNDARFTNQHLPILKNGERIYDQPEHDQLAAIWIKQRENFRQELARLSGIKLTDGRLSFELLRETYPFYWPGALRKTRKYSMESQVGHISKSNSIEERASALSATT